MITLACTIKSFSVTTEHVYQAHKAGSWYPIRSERVRALMKELDTEAAIFDQPLQGQVRAVVAPHAGYSYSGAVAAAVYRQLPYRTCKRIILLAPSHHADFKGIATLGYTAYKLPIGTVALEPILGEEIRKACGCFKAKTLFDQEHTIEMQLPFIHTYLPHAKVVPLLIGNLSEEQLPQCAAALAQLWDESTIVVVSSDFTHFGKPYGYLPYQHAVAAGIAALDTALVQALFSGNSATFQKCLQQTGANVCGAMPLRLLLAMIEAKKQPLVPWLVAYDTSTHRLDDDEQLVQEGSVSYLGLAWTDTRE
jgi:hypothetical protein